MSVGFDHREAGTPESVWRAEPRWADLPRFDAPGLGERLVVVAAHPDDESLGAGGLIATAAARGAHVRVIVASNGNASHPDSPTHTADRLADIRRVEVAAAVAELDPLAPVRHLDLPDGRLVEHHDELVAAIGAELAERTTLLTPWRHDRHPDHEACARAGAQAVATTSARVTQREYPIWLWHWARPDDPEMPWSDLAVLDLPELARQAKLRAIAMHRSQHEPLSDAPGDEAILPAALLDHFVRPVEAFVNIDVGGAS